MPARLETAKHCSNRALSGVARPVDLCRITAPLRIGGAIPTMPLLWGGAGLPNRSGAVTVGGGHPI